MRACSRPCAAWSPSIDRSRFLSEPSTLTKTTALRRSVEVSTPVIVTKPMRGSFSSPSASDRTSRTAAFTRRMRSLTGCHQLSLDAHELVFLAIQVPNRLLHQHLGLAVLARHAGNGQPRTLPEVVVVDFRDRRPEAVLQLRFCRFDVLPLALERPRLGEVELDAQDADVAGAHGGYSLAAVAGSGAGVSRSVRSTWRVSYASSTSPTLTSSKFARWMPHSKPSATSRASSWNRLSESIVVSYTTVPSRRIRTCAPRRTTPLVTMQPAIVPTREARKVSRTSASPIVSSVVTGLSMPTRACSMSSVSW